MPQWAQNNTDWTSHLRLESHRETQADIRILKHNISCVVYHKFDHHSVWSQYEWNSLGEAGF